MIGRDMAERIEDPINVDAAERLGRLVDVALRGEDWSSLKTLLYDIALTLRDADSRPLLGRTNLPENLVLFLHRKDPFEQTEVPNVKLSECLEEVGRVATNLVADCDDNRDRLSDLGYPSAVIAALPLVARTLPATRRSLLASLLNLTIEGHAKSLEQLSGGTAILVLLEEVNHGDDDGTAENRVSSTWALNILEQVVQHDSQDLALSTEADLAEQLMKPLYLLSQVPLQDSTDTPSTLFFKRVLISLVVLEKMFAQNEDSNAQMAFSTPPRAYDANEPSLCMPIVLMLKAFLASVHFSSVLEGEANAPVAGELASNEHGTYDRPNIKSVKAIRSSLVRLLVNLSAHLKRQVPSHAVMWAMLLGWLRTPEKDEAYGCGLLCLGNTLHNDADAVWLFSRLEPDLPLLIQQLSADRSPTTRHAVIGLIRNLSVAQANRAKLGELDLIGAFVRYAIFEEQNDMLGSVQGGAVVSLKTLCRDCPANAQQFSRDQALCAQLVALAKRTDEPAMRMEICRTFVSLLRTLFLGEVKEPNPIPDEQFQEVAALMSRTLCEKNVPPLIVHETVLGLSLLSAHADEKRVETITSELERDSPDDPNGEAPCKSGAGQLQKIADGKEAVDEAVQQNAQALLLRLGMGAGKSDSSAA